MMTRLILALVLAAAPSFADEYGVLNPGELHRTA